MRTAFQNKEFDELLAGTNDPTPSQIKGCYVVSSNDPSRGDIDIDILTGRFTGAPEDYDKDPQCETLLLFRVYNFRKKLLKKNIWPSNKMLQAFYKVCRSKCRKNGFEVSRHGG